MAGCLTLREFGEALRAGAGPDSEWGDQIIALVDDSEGGGEAIDTCEAVSEYLESWRKSRSNTAADLAQVVQAHIEAIDDILGTGNDNRLEYLKTIDQYVADVHGAMFDAGLIESCRPGSYDVDALLRMFLPVSAD